MTTKPKAFVHLGYGFGNETWNTKWKKNKLIGINEPFAYGYHHASDFGYEVIYSRDYDRSLFDRLIASILKLLIGVDIFHAWRNRRDILDADVIWTHTEHNSYAVALILLMLGKARRPKIIFQSIWLIDQWPKRNPLHRLIYHRLLSMADVLTFHSPLNVAGAREIFPHKRIEWVKFGISTQPLQGRERQCADKSPDSALRVIAVGNDIHRDWNTLRAAIDGTSEFELRIVSTRLDTGFLSGHNQVVRVASNAELLALYDWADVAIVPLTANTHVSGITAVQEAVLMGLPVICSDTGGLDQYFPADEVTYVPVGNPEALRSAAKALFRDPVRLEERVRRARSRMIDGDLNSVAFIRRHIEISNELLGRSVPTTTT